MKANVLVAPSHYLFSDKVKSEPAWSFALTKYLSPLVGSMDILSGVKDLNTSFGKNTRVFSLFGTRSSNLIVEFLRHVVFYPLITIQSLRLMSGKKYTVVHHMLPLSYATVNPLVFLTKIFFPKIKVVLGPLQLPQTQGDEQDLNVVLLGKQNYSFVSKLVYSFTMFITSAVKPIAAKMFETADLVVCNSETSLKHYSGLFPKAKFDVIYTGMDSVKVATHKYPVDQKKIKIMSAGLFSKRKGQIYLLRAMVGIVKKFPNVELTLIGGGDQDSVYREFVKKHKLEKKVIFTGQIPYADLLVAYQNHDIFCLPSISDTSPYVILEAMTFGLPIVTSEVGSIKEMIDKAGVTAKPGDSKSLEKALATVIADPKLRMQMGKYGVERVNKKFTWETISKQWLEVYNRTEKAKV